MTVRREIDRALLGRTSKAARRRLHDRLRADAQARAAYDRGAAALRLLEGGHEPAEFEIDLVEAWLREDGVLAEAPAPARTRWRGLWIALTIAAAAMLVVALRPRTTVHDDALVPKGPGRDRALAIDAVCSDAEGGEMVPAVGGCALGGTLAFAYRVDDRWAGGDTLVLFGVDERGESLYYVPTPDLFAPTVAAGRWTALERTVRLAVNHRAGRVRVFGLLTDTAPDLAAIDETAALLSALPPARIGDAPWHERLAGAGSIAAACARAQTCASAELELLIHEDRP